MADRGATEIALALKSIEKCPKVCYEMFNVRCKNLYSILMDAFSFGFRLESDFWATSEEFKNN